jgi:ubiquinone biosynthesis protein
MNPKSLKLIYQPAIRKAGISGLVGRNRNRTQPAKGRFTKADVQNLLEEVWLKYDQISLDAPPQTALGNQMNLYLACVTFCCFQALLELGVERHYAIELISDMAWKVYERWGTIPFILARFQKQSPREQMRFAVNAFLRFPFSPPGYILDRLPSEEGISFNIKKCLIAEYFRSQSATDLCVGTWCNLDFALAEMWGGRLERTQTLATGNPFCDFRFKALG